MYTEFEAKLREAHVFIHFFTGIYLTITHNIKIKKQTVFFYYRSNIQDFGN